MPAGYLKNLRPLCLILVLLTAAVLLLHQTPAGNRLLAASSEEAYMFSLLKSSGAAPKTASVTGWVQVNGAAPGAREPEEIAARVAGRLGLIIPAGQTEEWRNVYAHGIKLAGTLPGGIPAAVLGQAMEYPEGEKTYHVMVDLAAGDYVKARHYKKKVAAALRQQGSNERVAVTIAGWIDGALSDQELKDRAEELMRAAGATVRERTAKDNMISLTGYSPRFSRDLRYAGKEVNLNVAIRRGADGSGAYIYVASPVIIAEY